MPLSMTEEITRTFDLAALRFEASRNLTGRDWHTYQQLRARFDAERRTLDARHAREYDTRVEMARAALIDTAGAKSDEFKPRFAGDDRFDRRAIDRQAHRQARGAYLRAVTRLEERERDVIARLLEKAAPKREAEPRQMAKPEPQNAMRPRRSLLPEW